MPYPGFFDSFGYANLRVGKWIWLDLFQSGDDSDEPDPNSPPEEQYALGSLDKLTRKVLKAILNAFHIGLDVLLKVLDVLKLIGGNLITALFKFIDDPWGFVSSLYLGLIGGTKQFLGSFPDNVIGVLVSWLIDPLRRRVALPKEWTAEGVLGWVLDIAGLNSDGLQRRLQARGVSPQVMSQAQMLLIGDAGAKGSGLRSLIDEYAGDDPDHGFSLPGLLTKIGNDLFVYAQKKVKDTLTKKYDRIFGSGSVRQVIGSAATYITETLPAEAETAAKDLAETFKDLLDQIQRLVGRLVSAAGDEKQVQWVVNDGFYIVLPALLDVFKPTRLVKLKAKPFIDCIIGTIQGGIDRFLDWVLRKKCKVCNVKESKKQEKKPCSFRRKRSSCFIPGTLVLDGERRLVRIELAWLIRVSTWLRGEYGWRLAVEVPELFGNDRDNLRIVFLEVWEDGVLRTRVKLLRDERWVTLNGARLGDKLWLSMPEMGVEGWAVVTHVFAIRFEDLPLGPGRLVTAWFEHFFGEPFELIVRGVDGEIEKFGVTLPHPMWSADRRAFVAAGQLNFGERLLGRDGLVTVAAIGQHLDVQAVYTFEVDGDHVYRVGVNGVLVHNASVPTRGTLARETAKKRAESRSGWGELARGIRNLGKIRIRVMNKETESALISSEGNSKHSEKQLLAYARKNGIPACGTILWLYSERRPCSTCAGLITDIRKELKDAGQPSDFKVIALVPFDETRQYEAEPGGPPTLLWDPYLLSLSAGSYESFKLFHFNKGNWRSSEWNA